jgi:hypothetical protein
LSFILFSYLFNSLNSFPVLEEFGMGNDLQ